MKYFTILIFGILAAMAWVEIRHQQRKLLLKFRTRQLEKHFLNLLAQRTGEKFFTTPEVAWICKILLQEKDGEKALENLLAGKPQAAERILKSSGNLLEKAILWAFVTPEKAVTQFEVLLKKNPQNHKAAIYLAVLCLAKGEKKQAWEILEQTPKLKSLTYLGAWQNYLQAWQAMDCGGMSEAADFCSLAVSGFERNKAYYEMAKAHLLMGTIFRISAIEDVADFMLRAAEKIYAQLGCPDGVVEAKGNLGMLMAMQKRFDEAESFLEQALDVCTKNALSLAEAEITNQLALLHLLEGKEKEAQKLAIQAQKQHKKLGNSKGIAFSHEILGYISLQQKDYANLLKNSSKALALRAAQGEISAWMEDMYLQATALFETNQDDAAEKCLRLMIEKAQGAEINFHIAGAYSLLGLIFLKKGEMKRAKGLFFESLKLEQKNERLSGVAMDYANIALVEYKCGQVKQAQKNLNAAVAYAQAFEETELCEALRERLKKITC